MDPWGLAQASNYLTVRVDVSGYNPDIDAATNPETLWEPGGLYVWQTAAETLEMLSSSASDAAAGVGARTVRVSGLDASWVEQSEVVTLNGVGVVALVNSYLRINHIEVVTAGSTRSNVGTITLRRTAAGSTRGQIGVIGTQGIGVGVSGRYSVPVGKVLIVTGLLMNIIGDAATDRMTIAVFSRMGDVADSPFVAATVLGSAAFGASIFSQDMSALFIKFRAQEDIEFRTMESTGSNSKAQIRLRGMLVTTQP